MCVMYWLRFLIFFFFNDTATTEIYTLSLHDALPICGGRARARVRPSVLEWGGGTLRPRSLAAALFRGGARPRRRACRSEEHTSELQSRQYLVCRLLLEKKKKTSTK